MDLDGFREMLSNSQMDVWGIIDTAITVASEDYSSELKHRRDGIVERLYALQHCRNCDRNVTPQQLTNKGVRTVTKDLNDGEEGSDSPLSPQSIPRDDDEDEEPDPYGGLFDDEQTRVLRIREQLEDKNQSEDSVVELLQTLSDMDLTFKGLTETDIGRYVNQLRKHPSNEVRSLVKHLVRKWKELVDEWVGSNHTDHQHAYLIDGGSGSPLLQKIPRKSTNGNQQAFDINDSPNPHNWSPAPERINTELEQKPKGMVSKRPTPSRPISQSHPAMAPSASQNHPHKEQSIDPDKLASARKRLHENYQEAQNAKKQRTIQMMDIHEIPKPKNGFIAKNKGNFQGRHHR